MSHPPPPPRPMLLDPGPPHITVRQVSTWGWMKWQGTVHLGIISRDVYALTERGAERKARRLLAREERAREWREQTRHIVP